MRAALDTNVLAYAEGLGDRPRCNKALDLVERLPLGEVIIPAQTLGELSRVLRVKAKRSAEDTRSAVLSWADTFSVADSTWPAFQAALDLNVDHNVQIWDALILAVAAEQHCRVLLTEDMHAGFIWRGVTLVNPFAPETDPLLEQLLA